MATGTIAFDGDAGLFETLAPTSATGITASWIKPVRLFGVASATGATSITLSTAHSATLSIYVGWTGADVWARCRCGTVQGDYGLHNRQSGYRRHLGNYSDLHNPVCTYSSVRGVGGVRSVDRCGDVSGAVPPGRYRAYGYRWAHPTRRIFVYPQGYEGHQEHQVHRYGVRCVFRESDLVFLNGPFAAGRKPT